MGKRIKELLGSFVRFVYFLCVGVGAKWVKVLGYRKSDVAVVAGGKSRDKVVAVEGVVGKGVGEKERGEVVSGVLERLKGACRG